MENQFMIDERALIESEFLYLYKIKMAEQVLLSRKNFLQEFQKASLTYQYCDELAKDFLLALANKDVDELEKYDIGKEYLKTLKEKFMSISSFIDSVGRVVCNYGLNQEVYLGYKHGVFLPKLEHFVIEIQCTHLVYDYFKDYKGIDFKEDPWKFISKCSNYFKMLQSFLEDASENKQERIDWMTKQLDNYGLDKGFKIEKLERSVLSKSNYSEKIQHSKSLFADDAVNAGLEYVNFDHLNIRIYDPFTNESFYLKDKESYLRLEKIIQYVTRFLKVASQHKVIFVETEYGPKAMLTSKYEKDVYKYFYVYENLMDFYNFFDFMRDSINSSNQVARLYSKQKCDQIDKKTFKEMQMHKEYIDRNKSVYQYDDFASKSKKISDYDVLNTKLQSALQLIDETLSKNSYQVALKNSSVFPPMYSTPECIEHFMVLFFNKRADTIKELINLREDILYKQKVLEKLDNINFSINDVSNQVKIGFENMANHLYRIERKLDVNNQLQAKVTQAMHEQTQYIKRQEGLLKQILNENERHYISIASKLDTLDSDMRAVEDAINDLEITNNYYETNYSYDYSTTYNTVNADIRIY